MNWLARVLAGCSALAQLTEFVYIWWLAAFVEPTQLDQPVRMPGVLELKRNVANMSLMVVHHFLILWQAFLFARHLGTKKS